MLLSASITFSFIHFLLSPFVIMRFWKGKYDELLNVPVLNVHIYAIAEELMVGKSGIDRYEPSQNMYCPPYVADAGAEMV